jgi:hypothetical protein
VDTLANFSIETASPGSYWGTAVQQLPTDTLVPKTMQTASYAGVVHELEPTKEIKFKCYFGTWIRVVQYLSRDQIPSVSAKVRLDAKKLERFKRFWRREIIEQPQERLFQYA